MTVPFDDYQTGSLPDICVFTGASTSDRMVMRTRIDVREPAVKPPGRVLGALVRTTVFENPRAPRNLLVGKLPVDAGHLLARQRRERLLRLGGWGSGFALVVAAVSAQPWSPVVAVGSIAAMIVVIVGRIGQDRNVPTPTLIGAGTRVHLANVHRDFVDAVESDLRA